jgi:hypothetical protein
VSDFCGTGTAALARKWRLPVARPNHQVKVI